MKNKTLILYLLILITLLLNIFSFEKGLNWGDDYAHYIAQSKCLLNGSKYEFKNAFQFTFEQSVDKPGPIVAPWGFPLLLIPVLFFFNINVFIIKIYVFLFFLISLFIIYHTFKNRINQNYLLILIGLIAFHPSFFSFKENIQADYPHFLFAYLSLFLIQQFILYNKYFINKYLSYSLLGIILYFTFFIKTIGLVLFLTLFIVHVKKLMENNKLNFKYLFSNISEIIPYLTFILLAISDYFVLPSSHTTYNLGSDRTIWEYILINTKGYLEHIFLFTNMLSDGYKIFKIINLLVFLFALSLLTIAIIKNIKNDFIFIIYSLLVILVLLPLPFHGGGFRYIIPLFPVYLYFVFKGLEITIRFLMKVKYQKVANIAVITFFIILICLTIFKTYIRTINSYKNKSIIEGPYAKTSQELFKYIIENTKSDDHIIFFKPRVMYLYTHRLSYRIYRKIEKVDTDLIKILVNKDWDYFVLNNNYKIDTKGLSDKFKIVYVNDKFTMFKKL